GPYNLPHEAIHDPQVVANDFVVELEHPTFGPYTTTGMPVRFEKAPAKIPGPSPRFGQHTTDVLVDIGLDPAIVSTLIDDGTVIDGSMDGNP
ncbi:MAG: CoA transferase, partial [Actinomycetia bacterium]|nr:CoA transferase [Actinomycetes bacterium]